MPDAPVIEPVFRPGPAPFLHGMSTEAGPDLKSDPESAEHAAAVASLSRAVGTGEVAWARQVHGGEVLRVDGAGCAGEADALWTDRRGLAVMGRSADCPIVLVAGTARAGSPMWGMAHASWRSTAAGIVDRLLTAMITAGLDPETVTAAVAPSAGPCCYEVGPEVRDAVVDGLGAQAAQCFRRAGERLHFDLWAAAEAALRRGGIPSRRIQVDGRCTICGTGFPSFRREGDAAGRFGVLIGA